MSYMVEMLETATAAPRIVCDHCGEVVIDPGMAITVFDGRDLTPGMRKVKHLHKGACDSQGDDSLQWHELDTELMWLIKNLGMLDKDYKMTPKMESAISAARMFDGV